MALNLPSDYFAEAFAEPNCTIRLIHYPPQPNQEDNEFGLRTLGGDTKPDDLRRWIAGLTLSRPAQRIAFEEYVQTVSEATTTHAR